jgi:hypothetical protein
VGPFTSTCRRYYILYVGPFNLPIAPLSVPLSNRACSSIWFVIPLTFSLQRFGYNAAISQLLTVSPYVFASFLYYAIPSQIIVLAIILYVFAHYSDKLHTRSPFILAGLTMCLIGYSINISTVPSGVKYFGTFFIVTGTYAPFPGAVVWSVPLCSSDSFR